MSLSLDGLVSAAALGTARSDGSLAPDALPDGSRLPSSDPAQLLLRCAAAHLLYATAGQRLPVDKAAVLPALPEGGRELSDGAMRWLLRILDGEHPPVAEEWWALAHASARAIPAHWLPAVLPTLTVNARAEHRAVLGDGAAWLARLVPTWGDAVRSVDRTTWDTGSPDERREALRAIRYGSPATAREWIASTWNDETPEMREFAIETLRAGLTREDTPLLESAQDDKRKPVRLAATRLLALLPDSPLSQRCLDLSTSILTYNRKVLDANPPATFEKAWQRDGIEAKPPSGSPLGERAWWTAQFISLPNPTHWERVFRATPATLVRATRKATYGLSVLQGLSEAAVRHANADWAEATGTELLARTDVPPDRLRELLVALMDAIPAGADDRRVRLLQQFGAQNLDGIGLLLQRTHFRWNAEFTSAAFDLVHSALTGRERGTHLYRNALVQWGYRSDIATAHTRLNALLALASPDTPWLSAVGECADIVHFRHSMREDFRQ